MIPLVSSLLDFFGDGGGGGGDTFYVAGTQFNGDVAFNSVNYVVEQAQQASGEALPDGMVEKLNQAMALVEAKEFDRAIPLLEAVAKDAELPALYNNLGAAYLAAGEPAQAIQYFAKAPAEKTAQANRSLIGPAHPTEWPGVVAQVTRFDDVSGLITLEVTYQNVGGKRVRIYIWPNEGYLLDESTVRKWRPSNHDGYDGPILEPGEIHITWMKFQIDEPLPERFTAVADGVSRPFERLVLGPVPR